MAAEKILVHRRLCGGMISASLEVIWEMSGTILFESEVPIRTLDLRTVDLDALGSGCKGEFARFGFEPVGCIGQPRALFSTHKKAAPTGVLSSIN